MTTYRERREARADRLREWAEKREAKSEGMFERAHQMAEAIPFGQPVLVGHHSEGRDRNYRKRMRSTMDAACENARKAESMASRAAGIEAQLARSIYSDDEDAIEALRVRIAGLEVERDRVKAFNAGCRKGQRDVSMLTESERAALLSCARYSSLGKGGGFPGYHLTNLSGNINRNKKRLEELLRKEQER